MKKFFPYIIGLVIGIISATGLIMSDGVVYGISGAFDEGTAVLSGWSEYDFFEWNDVFSGGASGLGLYNLIYNKILVLPEKDALKETARKYGLTKDEARRVIDGSISVIFNNPNRRSAEMTQEDAYVLARNLQKDFDEISEMFALEQEIDTGITPSELFSNGDLYDSGFDLVYDLSVMEEILFLEKSETTLGHPFELQLDSPYLPTDEDQTNEFFVADQQSPYGISPAINAFAKVGSGLEVDEEDGDGGESDGLNAGLVLNIGDNDAIPVEILDDDECAEEGGFDEVLDKFEEDKAVEDAVDGGVVGVAGKAGGGGNVGVGGGKGPGSLLANGEEDGDSATDEDGNVLNAFPDKWGTPWCPGLGVAADSSGGSGTYGLSSFEAIGLNSLGQGIASPLNEAVGAFAGLDTPGFSANLAICFTTELIWKTVSSYRPGDSCIMCEIEKINELINKTLSHSLVPNKATGNLLESAKCKKSYQPLLDMQFIAIAAPIPSPPNDELIDSKSILEEWNEFTGKYMPLLHSDIDIVSEFEIETARPGETQDSVLRDISAQQSEDRAAAELSLEHFKVASEATNTMLYSQVVLAEIREMNGYVEHFKKIFEDINTEACAAIKKAKNLD